MVIVSPSDIILQEGKDTMNSTCAMGPRHNLFGGGIVSTIDSWHQINREPVSIKQESSPRSQDSEGSPYSTYSNGNEHHTGYYASYEDNNALSTSKDESNNNNNNNNNSTSSNQSLIPSSETTDEHPDGQSKAQDGDHPPAEEDGDALMRLQLALQRAAGDRQIQCPYCVFVTTSRASLELHLQQSHEDQRSCGFCDFTAETSEKLLEHVRESHSTPTQLNTTDADVRDDEDEPGLTVPKINSQGKVKTFRCKQCDFSAVTKLEFWEHTRSHIKQERLLTCPRCPFVTEYKHHLEYHLRNHFGSKPFKCDKCSYSCVNKSMLNSHLKSHSNVYQFSCADCNYATKYCHSLKLHLRKYDHKPAMVLNPDGSPNPLPIIDVYGTRRGPKMKHSRTSHNLDDQQSQSRTSPQHISSPLSIPEHPQQLQHQQPNLIHPLFASAYGLPYYNPLLHPLMYHAGKAAASQDAGLGSSVAMAEHQQDKANFYFNNNNIINNNCSQNGDEKEEVDMRFSPSMQLIETTTEQQRSSEDLSRVPLDLSRWDATTSQEEHSRSPPPRIVTQERRRKGKAYKLETLRQERTSEDDDEMRDTIETSSSSSSKRRHDDSDDGELPLKCVLVEQESSASASPEADRTSAKKAQSADSDSESYNCNYCDITFRDVVMYTMHMGYHGFGNPYTCNMCGETTADRVAFFLHIARTPHS